MLPKQTASHTPDFDLPEELLAVLPTDPYQQLDVARKITSIALATRVSNLESEASRLRDRLHEKDRVIADLQQDIEALDSSLAETSDKLARLDEEKENLLRENASLSSTVKKLQRDVSKLEIFKKTLMQSLQEEESSAGDPPAAADQIPSSSGSLLGEGAALPSVKTSLAQRQFSETTNASEDAGSVEMDAYRPGTSQGFILASQSSSPRLTPPDSPLRFSTSVSPMRSKPVSPRRHSISFSSTRNFDERASIFSSVSSTHSSMSGSLETGSQTGRSRVDGKEFFRQARSRLSYEQFGAFLSNVKDLNSRKQTKEETLKKSEEIFGPDNKDLYAVFEGLIVRNRE
ncbi:hypothetical protein H6P81_002007 [Aristolochia fimbriata]|uniref:At4g15545-like C-terminal domain-containing protein n=1 Tax=Aristolochia fimbriata TaxID=158543 RepID=A0AAV7F946_ARIFI|nr:hypothetical protein H6P81_002007 [Aristolochia fimbriata]